MLCDSCSKNQATVHLTEIIDDKMNELHLCEECARNKSAQMEQQFGLSDLLGGLAEFEKSVEDKDAGTLKCPNCGLSYRDFKKIGRLGCGDCYLAFKKYLGPLLKRIHGLCLHHGKSPVRTAEFSAKTISEMDDLRCRLQKAIEIEDFEEAVKIRDQIRQFQQKNPEENKEGIDAA